MSKKIRRFFSKYKYKAANFIFTVIPRTRGRFFNLKKGINLIGFYSEGMGLGQALRNAAGALLFVNIPFAVRENHFRLTKNKENTSLHAYLYKHCIYRYNLICFNPDFLYRMPILLRPKEWMTPYNIGYWFWEMQEYPKSWHYAFKLVDEVWVSSEFTLASLKKINTNVVKIPFAVEFDVDSSKFSRLYFDLSKDSFIFLYTFDFNSSYWRKNPLSVVEAFKRAFPDPRNGTVTLLIKVSNETDNSEYFLNLQEAVKSDSRIVLRKDDLNRNEMQGLLNIVDSYISLHRAEGLGLIMAESMYLGKPVIATGYSGNMEFMNAQNSCLVSYELIRVSNNHYIESDGQYWAEPNIAEAANYMIKIYKDKIFRSNMGKNAAKYMREHHSYKKMGVAILNRLEELEDKLNNRK